MKYTVQIERRAEKELDNLSPVDSRRLVQKILALEANPIPSNSLALQHPLSGYRLRVGSWRVFYHVDHKSRTILVYAVRHRREAYRRSH